MGTPVNPYPSRFDVAAVQTGQIVSSAGTSRIAEVCNFLGGYCLGIVADTALQARAVGRTQVSTLTPWRYPLVYYRHPGAQIMAVVVVLSPGFSATGKCSVSVTLPAGATWLEANGLDGSRNFTWPPTGRVARGEIVGYVDVTGCAVSSALYFSVESTHVTTNGISEGVLKLTCFEVAQGSANPTGDPSEPFLEAASLYSPNRITDGGASSPRGFARIAGLLDSYRTGFKPTAALIGLESADNTVTATNPHWHRVGAGYGALEWQFATALAFDVKLYGQARNLYAVGVGAGTQTRDIHIRYKTTGANAGGLKLFATAIGGGATALAAQTVALAATANVWTWKTASVNIPADGAAGLFQCTFTADCGAVAVDPIQFANLSLVDTQT